VAAGRAERSGADSCGMGGKPTRTETETRVLALNAGKPMRTAPRRALVTLVAAAVVLPLAALSASHAGGTPAWSSAGPIVLARLAGGDSELYVATTHGRIVRRLTRNRWSDFLPRWSPNGRRIAFVSDRDGDDEIYVMNVDGSGVRKLTRNRCADFAPAWSPNGRTIAFARDRGRDCVLPPEIYVVRANGRRLRRLTRTPPWVVNTTPTWSPDGRSIVFASSRAGLLLNQLYVMRADGRRVRRLTRTPDVDASMPAWSPDGRTIAFVSLRAGSNDIYVMNADGTEERRLTDNPRIDLLPRFSPNGKRLVFARLGLPDGKTVDEIFVINTDGKHERRVGEGFDADWRG
jgi:TolB protein